MQADALAGFAVDVLEDGGIAQPVVTAVVVDAQLQIEFIRQNLDPDSPYADVAIHADGHITLQYREKKGGETADMVSPLSGSKRIRIERHGDVFTASAQAEDGKMIPFARYTVALKDPVFVGVGSCSHDVKKTVIVNFSHIEIERFGK